MNKKRKIQVAPSLLAADFNCLEYEIRRAERAGADQFHVDVMDGHFVNNISLGPFIVKAMRKATNLPLVSHLMIENPEKYAGKFAEAGSNAVIFHIETTKNPRALIRNIKKYGKKAGVSLKPGTKAEAVNSILPIIDEVLVMTVEPGFGGQEFMKDQIPKIREIRKRYDGDIAVDGGINYETAKLSIHAGANILVAGTYLFGARNIGHLISRLKSLKS